MDGADVSGLKGLGLLLRSAWRPLLGAAAAVGDS